MKRILAALAAVGGTLVMATATSAGDVHHPDCPGLVKDVAPGTPSPVAGVVYVKAGDDHYNVGYQAAGYIPGPQGGHAVSHYDICPPYGGTTTTGVTTSTTTTSTTIPDTSSTTTTTTPDTTSTSTSTSTTSSSTTSSTTLPASTSTSTSSPSTTTTDTSTSSSVETTSTTSTAPSTTVGGDSTTTSSEPSTTSSSAPGPTTTDPAPTPRLPETGADVAPLAAAAGLTLLSGFLLLFAPRRRP